MNELWNEILEGLRHPMVVVGFAGQVVFSMRFLVQWIQSERAGRSIVPEAFWYLSIVGSMLLLVYALWRRDAVFTLGQSFGFIVYARNLVLHKRAPT